MPVEELAKVLPRLTYQVYFEKRTADAVKELDSDIRRTLRATLRTVASPPPEAYLKSHTDFLSAYDDIHVSSRALYLFYSILGAYFLS